MEITIKEYAERNGISHVAMRHRCERGCFQTARKLGRDWVIDENEKFSDRRVKSGKYKGVRTGETKHKRENENEKGNV